jgi:ABC-2 type transport system permease protein
MTPREAARQVRQGLPVPWPVPWPGLGQGPGRIAILVRHNFALLTREPGPLISRLVQPVVLMMLMRPLYMAALARYGAQAGTAQVVTGMLVLFSLLALSVVGGAIMAERAWRTWDRLRVTPARAGELLLGKAIPAFALLAVQQAVVISFGVVVFGLDVRGLGLVATAIACWALALLGIGAVFGAMLRSQSELQVAYDIGGVLLSALGGAMVPLTTLPRWAQAIAPASPGYWAMSALRSALLGQAAGTMRAASVLLAIAAITGTLAAWRISRGWPRSRLL